VITADQLLAHAIGDYLIQSDWMANEKTKRSFAAALHALTYTLPFLFLTLDPLALCFISGTHFVIDRWRLARYVTWLRNAPYPGSRAWSDCAATGSPPERPEWLTVWLLIIVDNTLHVLLNAVALRWIT
jgi:Protein of unknown function (DUF3307)